MIETTYNYYHNVFNGELDETDFNKYYKKAGYKLDDITNGSYKSINSGSVPESMRTDVRELTCEVIDKLAAVDAVNAETGNILGNAKSIKSGSVSITYASSNEGGGAVNSRTVDGNIRDLVIEYCGKYGWGCRWA